jgi:23S rRNA pseudouridine955/2504/2580 synthase
LTAKSENRYENDMIQELICPRDEVSKTAENFLKKRFPIGYVRKLFRKNGVKLNGNRCKPKDITRAGDVLRLLIPFESRSHKPTSKEAPDIPLEVVFENQDLLVINKPAGLAVHEGKTIPARHSLLGVLQARQPSTGVAPKLVHRLDKETSGLLLVAKNDSVSAELQLQFETGRVDKEYLALVAGRIRPRSGTIDLPLPGRDGNLVAALTHYRVDQEFDAATLLRVRIKTGRMHQIRLHLARIGHPVVLDSRHGDFAFNKTFRKTHGLKRQFLHACSISLTYKGEDWSWSAPLPADLRQTLTSLSSSSAGPAASAKTR